jgi:hypothetical protein
MLNLDEYVLDKESKFLIFGNDKAAYYLDDLKKIFFDRIQLCFFLINNKIKTPMHKKVIVSQLTLHEIFHGDQNRIMNR